MFSVYTKNLNIKNLIVYYLLILCTYTSYSQKILFVGNSLTYQNGMPLILEEIGSNFGKEIITEMICKPNFAIIDHLEEGVVKKEIENNSYDLVIIQQGPSSQILGRKMLIEDGQKLAKICKTNNTKLGYFMVWPSKKYYFTFDKIIANYKAGAEHNNAILFPVGKIWRTYEKAKNKVSLYSNDNFHPSKIGSFLAALTIFKTLHPKEDLNKLPFSKIHYWAEHEKSYQLILKILNKN